jgi:ketosteroid isomerase-like protein
MDNVEVIRQFLEAVNRADVEGMTALMHDDAEFVPILAAMEGVEYSGHAGVRQFIKDLFEHWEFFETVQEEWQDLGDRVVAIGSWHARGKASGVEIENQPAVWLAHVRDGRIVRWRTYTDIDQGLAEAGIAGEASRRDTAP